MSSYSRYDDRRYSSSSRRDRDSSRRSSPGPSRGRSPPPPVRPRGDNELPLEFGRPVEPTSKEDENTVIKRMKTAFTHSPLSVIYDCIKDSLKIKIWTRNFKEVRGICSGYVVAFDKHWNLVMIDVEEVYLKPKKAKTPFLLDTESAEDMKELPPRVPRVKKEKTPEEVEAEKKKKEEAEKKKKEEAEKKKKEEAEKKKAAGEESGKPKKKKRRKGRRINKRYLKQLFVRGDNIVMLCVLDPDDEDSHEIED